MDGRDSSGRTISLLNSSSTSEGGDWKRFPPRRPLPQRVPSSCATSPSPSPARDSPPTLSRSSSSSDSRHLAPISPLTPSDTNPQLDSIFRAHQPQHQQYFLPRPSQGKMDDQNASMYPPIPDATGAMTSAYPMPAQIAQQLPPQQPPAQSVYRSSTSPSSEPSRVSTVSATSNAKSQPKKNSYPCPMAKQFGCTDFFTTSGHAARHAKKHTGKKDAFCPECNKAFTRKDNMEQHRRTHQNGRGNPRPANATASDDGKVKKSTKQPAAKKIKAEPQVFEAAVEQQLAEQPQPPPMVSIPAPMHEGQPMAAMAQPVLDQSMTGVMPVTTGGPYFMNGSLVDIGPVPALPMAVPDMSARPPLHRSNFTSSLDYTPPVAPMGIVADPDASLHYSYPSPGLSNGLNSLALASEHRRLSEEKAQSHSPQETPSTETP